MPSIAPGRWAAQRVHPPARRQVRDASVSRDNSQFASVGGDKQVGRG